MAFGEASERAGGRAGSMGERIGWGWKRWRGGRAPAELPSHVVTESLNPARPCLPEMTLEQVWPVLLIFFLFFFFS
jgi:hypothetical protein